MVTGTQTQWSRILIHFSLSYVKLFGPSFPTSWLLVSAGEVLNLSTGKSYLPDQALFLDSTNYHKLFALFLVKSCTETAESPRLRKEKVLLL